MKSIIKEMCCITLCAVGCIVIFFGSLDITKHFQIGNYAPKEIVKEVTDKNLYPMTSVVIDLDNDKNIITVVDFNGEKWNFVCEDDVQFDEFQISSYVSLIMDSKATPKVMDDEVVSYKYDGWCRGEFGYDTETECPVIEFYE